MKKLYNKIAAFAALALLCAATFVNTSPPGNNVNSDLTVAAINGSVSNTGSTALAAPDIGQNGLAIVASAENKANPAQAFKDATANGKNVIVLNVAGENTNTIVDNMTTSPPAVSGALANNGPAVNNIGYVFSALNNDYNLENNDSGNVNSILLCEVNDAGKLNENNKIENGTNNLAANENGKGAGGNEKLQMANIGGGGSDSDGSAVVTG